MFYLSQVKFVKHLHCLIEDGKCNKSTENIISEEHKGRVGCKSASPCVQRNNNHQVLNPVGDVISATPHDELRKVPSSQSSSPAAYSVVYLNNDKR